MTIDDVPDIKAEVAPKGFLLMTTSLRVVFPFGI